MIRNQERVLLAGGHHRRGRRHRRLPSIAGRTAAAPAQHPVRAARRSPGGHARLRRAPLRQDAADRSHRERRRELQERLLHDVAVLAEPGVAPERRLRAQARRDQQLHRVPGRDEQLSQGAAAGRLRDRLRRQVPHGRGQRRAASGLRLLRHAQGPGQVLRHRVQPQRRAARGQVRLLHDRRSPTSRSTGCSAITAASRG